MDGSVDGSVDCSVGHADARAANSASDTMWYMTAKCPALAEEVQKEWE